ncbi:MAG: radical SAM protein [Bacteroidales bacterium]|jgi:anaerobic magnesium-protoporphyrin IX monomethyl ester cyclase|nr:radical SAM protein [Bacteroidales bacterium]
MKKGKALFVIHDVYQDFNAFPLGPAYLAAELQKEGHDVEIYNQDVFHQTNEELGEYLENNDFDMINLGFLSARYAETIRPLAETINQHKKGAKFVIGGHGTTAIPEYTLKDINADVAILGEAEQAISPLLEKIVSNEDYSKIPGVAINNNGNITLNQRSRPVNKLDQIPFPAWELFPIKEYSSNLFLPGAEEGDKTLAIISARGCVGECSFCYRIEDGVRMRSIDNLEKEMTHLQKEYDINYFQFQDEMLIPSKKRATEMMEMFDKIGPIKYYCQSRVELARNQEILKMLKDSGCQLLNFGLESLDQNVLNLMNKRVNVADNYTAVENTIKAGIHPGLNFIWGSPGDNINGLEKITQFLIDYDTMGQLRTIRPPTPYPGAPLYHQAIKDGKLNGPEDFFNRFTNSDRLTVNFTDMPDDDVHYALLDANSKLIMNHYKKTGKDLEGANSLIDGFRKVYFPKSESDLKFRGARIYNKK